MYIFRAITTSIIANAPNADLQQMLFEESEFDQDFAHRHREREEYQNAVDRENEVIFHIQQPNRPLPIDEIFDIDVDK